MKLAEAMPSRSPDVDFELGLAYARLGRWNDAHRAMLEGQRACPGQKRFAVELAGVAFERKQYAAAAHWLRRALRLDPRDGYANNFLGTVYFLSGNLDAALRYWNRVNKPRIAALHFDPHLRVHRLLLDRAFAFSPAAVLREPQLTATEARLQALGIFPSWSIHLNPRQNGAFDAVFRAQELDGFGAGRFQALLSTFSGLPYETIYPRYLNMRRSAVNFDSLLRWDSQKRRLWLSLSAPSHELPQWRWGFAADLRDENWAIRRSFTGVAPVLGSLHLNREVAAASFTAFAGGRLRWSLGGELSHRTFGSVNYGSALTKSLLTPGFEIKQLASIDERLANFPQLRFTLDAGASSELARTISTPSHICEKLRASVLARWLPGIQGHAYELTQRLRAGTIFGSSPFDELYMLGMDRDDTDLWMRGIVATRDGRKGSAPIGNGYFLSNSEFDRRLYSNGLISLDAGPLLDIGRMSAPNSGLSTRQWLFDPGVEARVSVLHTTVVLSYGHDMTSGANAFYGMVAQPEVLP